MIRRSLVSMVLVLLFLAAAPCVYALGIGDMLPETVKAVGMDGKEVSVLSVVKGKNSVMIFLTAACNQCLQETKYILENYGDERLLVISVDMGGSPAMERWKKMYLAEYKPGDMTILMDPEFNIAPQFGISTTPSSVFADKEGKIVNVKGGFNNATKDALKELFGK